MEITSAPGPGTACGPDAACEPDGTAMLRELAALDLEVDGVEALHQLVAEILGQISTQDAWAGRTGALEAPHACGGCGRWQQVTVPFLHHVCESCRALWVPGHCLACGRTQSTLLADFEEPQDPACTCGQPLQRLGLIPKPRSSGADTSESLNANPTMARRAGLTVRLSGIAAALVAVGVAVLIVVGQGAPEPPARPAVVAAHLTPPSGAAALGADLGRTLRAHGLPATTFSCADSLRRSGRTLMGRDRAAYVQACAG